jgi:hypothetical protein
VLPYFEHGRSKKKKEVSPLSDAIEAAALAAALAESALGSS